MVTGVVPHVGGPILPPGCPTVLIGMMPAARVTDMATCVGPPDVIVKGCNTVLIGNMPAARLGDQTAHGGVIVVGYPTVIIGDSGSGASGGAVGCAIVGSLIGATAGMLLGGPLGAIVGGIAGAIAGVVASSPGQPPLFGQETPMSCGIASVRMVLASEGINIPEATLRAQSQNFPGAYNPAEGTSMGNLSNLLRANGVSNASGPKSGQTVDTIRTATANGNPAIVHFNNPDGGGHFVVVDGVRTNSDGSRTMMVRDPWPPNQGTRTEMSETDFNNRGFSGWVITTN